MEIRITSDSWWETRVGESLETLSLRKINDYFYLKNYSDELEKVVLCFFCCNPDDYGELQQKVKYSKKEKCITIFFILDFSLFMSISDKERKGIILNMISNEVPVIVKQKLSAKFNFEGFKNDWHEAFEIYHR